MTAAAADEGAGGVELDATERDVIAAVNATRADAGLRAVTASTRITKAADYHSREMVRGNYFTHDSLNGWDFAERLRRLAGVTRGGEVIAYALTGSAGEATADAVMTIWMESPLHRKQLLGRAYRRIGVAQRVGPFQGTDAAVFTVDLAR